MAIVYRLNGERVTKEQLDARQKEREELFGKDYFDFKNWNGQVPTIRTNDTFMRGRKHGKDLGMDDEVFEQKKRVAAAAGVSIQGRDYFGQLCDGPDDPDCWAGSADEVVEIARRKKMLVELNGRRYDFREQQRERKEGYEVAADLVEDEVVRYIEREHGNEPVSDKKRAEIREFCRDAAKPEGM